MLSDDFINVLALLESFREEECKIIFDDAAEVICIGEKFTGDPGIEDYIDHGLQTFCAIGCGTLAIHESRVMCRKLKFILQPGDFEFRNNPSIFFTIDPDKNLALGEV